MSLSLLLLGLSLSVSQTHVLLLRWIVQILSRGENEHYGLHLGVIVVAESDESSLSASSVYAACGNIVTVTIVKRLPIHFVHNVNPPCVKNS